MLLLGGERQRRPEPAVLQRRVRVAVVGHLDLDQSGRSRAGVAARRLRALARRRAELLGVELHALAGGADEPVARAARVLRHDRAARGDVDRHRLLGPVVDRRRRPSCSTRPRTTPSSPVHSSRISRTASRSRAKRSLNSGHSRPDTAISLSASPVPTPSIDPPRVEQRQRGQRLRQHRRVVAERRGQHARCRAGSATCAPPPP